MSLSGVSDCGCHVMFFIDRDPRTVLEGADEDWSLEKRLFILHRSQEWWTDLWLNEGFARFMENLATNELFPEYDIWTQFVSEGLNQALGVSSSSNFALTTDPAVRCRTTVFKRVDHVLEL